MSDFDSGPVVRLLSMREVVARTTLSRTTLWRKARAGKFPQPLMLGEQRIAWRESDVAEWIATRAPRRARPAAER